MKNKLVRLMVLGCAAALLCVGLAGCMPPAANSATDAQNANRTYMNSVNQAMEDLDSRLAAFDDAVARGDAVTMRTQADNAFAAIDTLSTIDTPDDMKELQSNYVDGCRALEDALSQYIDLYNAMESATGKQPFDYSTYDDRLKAIQDKYNEGIQKLKDADAKAVELNDGDGDESRQG